MRLNEVVYTDAKPIEGYGPGFFRISGQVFEGAIVALPTGVAPWGGYDDAQTLLDAAGALDVFFVGQVLRSRIFQPICAQPSKMPVSGLRSCRRPQPVGPIISC